jgi:mannose-6-phosphate isomerase-like protein (cupin superfamily)
MKIIRGADLSFTPASHEDPKKPGVLKKILCAKDDCIDGRVQMINWALLPQGSRFNRHYHQDMQEIFIILNGSVSMLVGEEEETLRGGDAVVIPPLAHHEMRNTSSEDVQYIVVGVSLGKGGKTVVVE